MPFLSMVRSECAETFSLIQRFSLATQKRRSCRLGRKRRRVLLLACETLLPVCTRLPDTWHTRDIDAPRIVFCRPWPGKRRPRRWIGARYGSGSLHGRRPDSRFRAGSGHRARDAASRALWGANRHSATLSAGRAAARLNVEDGEASTLRAA